MSRTSASAPFSIDPGVLIVMLMVTPEIVRMSMRLLVLIPIQVAIIVGCHRDIARIIILDILGVYFRRRRVVLLILGRTAASAQTAVFVS